MGYANKIILNGEVLIDLTNDTADKPDVVCGKTFHKNDGSQQEGTCEVPVVNLQEKTVSSNCTVEPDYDDGYTGLSKVTVEVPQLDTSDANATGAIMIENTSAYVNGNKVTGKIKSYWGEYTKL